jgi:uncharacterized membrane protein
VGAANMLFRRKRRRKGAQTHIVSLSVGQTWFQLSDGTMQHMPYDRGHAQLSAT